MKDKAKVILLNTKEDSSFMGGVFLYNNDFYVDSISLAIASDFINKERIKYPSNFKIHFNTFSESLERSRDNYKSVIIYNNLALINFSTWCLSLYMSNKDKEESLFKSGALVECENYLKETIKEIKEDNNYEARFPVDYGWQDILEFYIEFGRFLMYGDNLTSEKETIKILREYRKENLVSVDVLIPRQTISFNLKDYFVKFFMNSNYIRLDLIDTIEVALANFWYYLKGYQWSDEKSEYVKFR